MATSLFSNKNSHTFAIASFYTGWEYMVNNFAITFQNPLVQASLMAPRGSFVENVAKNNSKSRCWLLFGINKGGAKATTLLLA